MVWEECAPDCRLSTQNVRIPCVTGKELIFDCISNRMLKSWLDKKNIHLTFLLCGWKVFLGMQGGWDGSGFGLFPVSRSKCFMIAAAFNKRAGLAKTRLSDYLYLCLWCGNLSQCDR